METLCEYADALDKSTAPEAVGGGTTRRLCRSISGDQMAMHRQKISMIKDAVRKAKASYRDAQLVRPAPRARTRRTALPAPALAGAARTDHACCASTQDDDRTAGSQPPTTRVTARCLASFVDPPITDMLQEPEGEAQGAGLDLLAGGGEGALLDESESFAVMLNDSHSQPSARDEPASAMPPAGAPAGTLGAAPSTRQPAPALPGSGTAAAALGVGADAALGVRRRR